MIDLNSSLWKELGYEEIPDLLRDVAKDPSSESWGLLNEALIDQGDVGWGAYAAVPHLIKIAVGLPIAEQVELWDLIGYVASRGPRYLVGLPPEVRDAFISSMREAKTNLLQAIGSHAIDERQTVYLLQALAAVVGCFGPGRILYETLYATELAERCPLCIALLRIYIREDGILLRTASRQQAPRESWLAAPTQEKTPDPTITNETNPDRCHLWMSQMLAVAGFPLAGVKSRPE